jgi:hypothetical protein
MPTPPSLLPISKEKLAESPGPPGIAWRQGGRHDCATPLVLALVFMASMLVVSVPESLLSAFSMLSMLLPIASLPSSSSAAFKSSEVLTLKLMLSAAVSAAVSAW